MRVTTPPPLPLHNYLRPAEARSVVHARPPAKRRAVSIAREPIQDHTSTRARTFHRHAPSLEIQRIIFRFCLLAADTSLVLHNKSGHERAPFQLTWASLMECTARPPAHISRFNSDPTFTQRAAVLLLERLSGLSTPTRQRPTDCSILGLAPPLPCATMRDRSHARGCSTVCDLPPHPCSPYIPRLFTVNPGYHPHVPRP